MDSAEQAKGEKTVRKILIEPLLRRGLAKPTSLTKKLFEDMCQELCAKLAYMSELNLAALEEEAAGMAGGKGKDRFPVGQKILDRAVKIQRPSDDASPLIRSVFSHQIGADALAEGWAPELLKHIRSDRRFPGSWALKGVMEAAEDPVRRLRAINARIDRNEPISADESAWRSARLADVEKCRRIAELGTTEGGAE